MNMWPLKDRHVLRRLVELLRSTSAHVQHRRSATMLDRTRWTWRAGRIIFQRALLVVIMLLLLLLLRSAKVLWRHTHSGRGRSWMDALLVVVLLMLLCWRQHLCCLAVKLAGKLRGRMVPVRLMMCGCRLSWHRHGRLVSRRNGAGKLGRSRRIFMRLLLVRRLGVGRLLLLQMVALQCRHWLLRVLVVVVMVVRSTRRAWLLTLRLLLR